MPGCAFPRTVSSLIRDERVGALLPSVEVTGSESSSARRSHLKANLLVRLPGLMRADLNRHLPVQPP